MKFRKKPAIVEAIKFEYTKDGVARLRAFAGENVGLISKSIRSDRRAVAQIITSIINVDYDTDRYESAFAFEGDLVVKDENGKFYPCNPDRFHKEFEPILNKKGEIKCCVIKENHFARTNAGI